MFTCNSQFFCISEEFHCCIPRNFSAISEIAVFSFIPFMAGSSTSLAAAAVFLKDYQLKDNMLQQLHLSYSNIPLQLCINCYASFNPRIVTNTFNELQQSLLFSPRTRFAQQLILLPRDHLCLVLCPHHTRRMLLQRFVI